MQFLLYRRCVSCQQKPRVAFNADAVVIHVFKNLVALSGNRQGLVSNSFLSSSPSFLWQHIFFTYFPIFDFVIKLQINLCIERKTESNFIIIMFLESCVLYHYTHFFLVKKVWFSGNTPFYWNYTPWCSDHSWRRQGPTHHQQKEKYLLALASIFYCAKKANFFN